MSQVSTSGSVSDCRAAVRKYWPQDSQQTALAVMEVESGNNPTAHNFSHSTQDDSWGCFQINRYGNLAAGRPAPDLLVSPDFNVRYALGMYQAQGWCDPWHTTSKKLGICR